MTPCIDVVVVAYGTNESIAGALRVADDPLVASVTVVDHNPLLATRPSAPKVVVVHDATNPGFGAGQNNGARRGRAEYVLILNPDAEMLPGALDAGVGYLATNPGVGGVQGVVLNCSTGEPERSSGLEIRPFHLAARAVGAKRLLRIPAVRSLARRTCPARDHVERRPSGPCAVESLAATALLVRRRAFEQIGGFDEDYFLYGEDIDLCRRLRGSGWSLAALPTDWATHENGASATSSWSREVEWWRGTLTFGRKWWGVSQNAAATAAALVEIAVLIVRRPLMARAAARILTDRRRRSSAVVTT